MNRAKSLEEIANPDITWDIIIIGGGASGLGIALDAILRGYKTLLLEQSDFCKATSSRSTKLVHGGVRYLAQGNIGLVFEALQERGFLLKNAPHLVKNIRFVIPSYHFWRGYFYSFGLKIYDILAGNKSLGKSKHLNALEVQNFLPTVATKSLKNGTLYHDGQFDDARLGISLAQSAVANGAAVLNYMKVVAINKNQSNEIEGVTAIDLETETAYVLKTKVLVNATGVFADSILAMDTPEKQQSIIASQGTHLVLDAKFFPGETALMIPKTTDGRVLFAIPWYGKVLVGTTDILVEKESLEPRALESEIDFILLNLNQYLEKNIQKNDILSVFSGLRPLAKPASDGGKTKEISRSHKIMVSKSGLFSIIGGKWTTYRRMAEDVLDAVIVSGKLKKQRDCCTKNYKIFGYLEPLSIKTTLSSYGTAAQKIIDLAATNPELSELLHPNYPFIKAEVIWATRHEMARNVEDVLARRLRLLFLDARAAFEVAPTVAKLLAAENNFSEDWIQSQILSFQTIAKGYWIA